MSLRNASLLSALLLSACATGSSRPLELAGTHWRLVAAEGGPMAVHAAASGITLEFAADRIAGHGGCNRYSGSYTLQAGVLTVGPVISTKMACIEAVANESERAWYAALAAPIAVTQDGDVLILRTADGAVMRFSPAEVP